MTTRFLSSGKNMFLFGVVTFLSAPLFVFAQGTLITLSESALEIIRAIVPTLIGFAVVFFIWGVAKFILNADNKEEQARGRQLMIWGIVALFVMVSIWGLVAILGETFDIKPETIQVDTSFI